MAGAISSPPLLFLALALLVSCSGSTKMVNAQYTWCVARRATSSQDLQNNIDFACSMVDCSIILPGGSCFLPNTRFDHASVAMNLYYKAYGRNPLACFFNGSGAITVTDPSREKCRYA